MNYRGCAVDKDCLGGAVRVGERGSYLAATMGRGVFHECHASHFGLCNGRANADGIAPLDRLEYLIAEMPKGNALRLSKRLAE